MLKKDKNNIFWEKRFLDKNQWIKRSQRIGLILNWETRPLKIFKEKTQFYKFLEKNNSKKYNQNICSIRNLLLKKTFWKLVPISIQQNNFNQKFRKSHLKWSMILRRIISLESGWNKKNLKKKNNLKRSILTLKKMIKKWRIWINKFKIWEIVKEWKQSYKNKKNSKNRKKWKFLKI